MILEKNIAKAQRLAMELSDIEDNEVKKVYTFLCCQKDITSLHRLLKALAASPFRERSSRTRLYYTKMNDVIKKYLPENMDVADAVQILGWACRLLKYQKLKNEQAENVGSGKFPSQSPRSSRRRGGKRR
ncbi:MAG TPA: hypothetical protein VNP04_25360 [Alphaproteobacteria bacterium]|nr:hypothetical protein [Alphaproteobacteria bacterium]